MEATRSAKINNFSPFKLELAMTYETVIGLEVHAQLKTKSKIFCNCPTEFGKGPNDQVCPVCLGMPGLLPVLNRKAVEYAIKTGLALNCEIAESTMFDRKNYFYPDLPKGYQISQFDRPICRKGHLVVGKKTIRIHRAHLEEDAGKLVHAGAAGLHGSDYSLVDFNRSGVPLLEIVSEPDIASPEEARQYLSELRNILRYLNVCDGNLEEGSFRCDANVSLRPSGASTLGTKVEIKNMNSFKAVQRALQSEIERQTECLNKGQRIVQETRLWNEADGTTISIRSKEEAHDYRYFPEPDLVPLTVSRQWVNEIKDTMPELPEARRQRYISKHALPLDDAIVLVEFKELSDFFDKVLALGANAKAAANWLIGPTIAWLKENKKEFSDAHITPKNMKDLIDAVSSGTIGSTTAKELLLQLLKEAGDVETIIKSKSLAQISDEVGLRAVVSQMLTKFPTQLDDYRKGRTKVRQFFFGEIMKETKGKANPQVINKLLDELLGVPELEPTQ
jgi:aspartyl-tRNA(Asn)/glutamyl-tRNA(Gln) amidotransferase subunit B